MRAYEIPYRLEVVKIGETDAGEDITSCIVAWGNGTGSEPAKAPKEQWPKSLKVFRDAMANALAASGVTVRPFGMVGPEVRAARQTDVRCKFVVAYPADGDTPAQWAEAKK